VDTVVVVAEAVAALVVTPIVETLQAVAVAVGEAVLVVV
jgi:hypothetical protein